MTAQKGKDLLLKIEDNSAFVTIAGLRTRQLSLNAQSVDITHSESAGQWRELLSGAGVRKASLSASGLFKDAASDALLRSVFFAGEVRNYQIIIPAFGTLQGAFLITALEYRGEHTAEITFDVALESAGEMTFISA